MTFDIFTHKSNLVPYACVWENAKIVDFSETFAVYEINVGMYCKLNEYMKLLMCLRSRSFFDLGPRSLRFRPQHIQTSPQKPLEIVKFHLDPSWDGGPKVCSNDPGHMAKRATIPIYDKKLLLWNQLVDIVETWYTESGTRLLPSLFKR